MLHQQVASYAVPQCLKCTLHFAVVLLLTVGTQGLYEVQAKSTVDIFPVQPTFLANSSFNLSCTVAQSSLIRGEDIRWSRDGVNLPTEWYRAVDDSTSQLIIKNADFSDSGLYACVTEQSSLSSGNSTEVLVGVPPSSATNLSCSSTNYFDVTCTWDQGIETNINTSYTVQFAHNHESDDWFTCLLKQHCECSNGRMCTVKGMVHGIAMFRVLSTNKLGDAHTQCVPFDIDKDTIPNPPEHVVVEAKPGSQFLATWDIPHDWKKSYESSLLYKLEYRPQDSLLHTKEDSTVKDGNTQLRFPAPGALQVYTIYCIRVAAKFIEGKTWSEWSDEFCQRTLEEVPNAAVNATWTAQPSQNPSLREVLIMWQPLPKVNERGLILGYHVTNMTFENNTVTTLGANSTNITIPGMDRFTTYKFAVDAFNSAGSSPRTFLDVTAEVSQSASPAVIIVAAVLTMCGLLAVMSCIMYMVHLWFRKPVPSISFIALDRFERVACAALQRGVRERETFDDLVGYHTANGVVPNGDVARDDDSDYVSLRRQHHPAETFPLLHRNSRSEPDTEQGSSSTHRKMSQASADSANSSEGSSDKELFSAASTTDNYGQFASLFVEIPEPSSTNMPQRSCMSQPRLDSTDSGFTENSREYRVPSYTKLTTIPSEPGVVDIDINIEEDYHSMEDEDPQPLNPEDNLDQSIYANESGVPSYTRLSSLVGLIPGTVSSLEHHTQPSILNGTVPSVGNLEQGDT